MMDWQRETHGPGRVPGRAALATSTTTRSTSSRPRARCATCPPARRRSTSPTTSTPTSATAAWAPRSTAASCRSPTRSSRATSSRSSPRRPPRGPSRDWLNAGHHHQGALQDQPVLPRASAGRTPSTAAASCCRTSCARPALPSQRVVGSPLLLEVIQEMGFKQGRGLLHLARPREDLRAGGGQQDPAPPQGRAGRGRGAAGRRSSRAGARTRSATASSDLGIEIDGPRRRAGAPGQVLQAGARRPDPGLHLAGPRHHHPPRGLPQRAGAAEERPSGSRRSPGAAPTSSPFG